MLKKRLDVLVVEKGLAPSREKAKAYIMAGLVYVNGQKEIKAGDNFSQDADIEVKGEKCLYVSRGGLKLEKAVEVFSLNISGKVCIDIGASTGGFTDVCLKNGALRVYSVDVGYGQLAWELRQDPRVICMEKTNFRYLTEADLSEKMDLAVCDVSFISLTKILGPAFDVLKPDGEMICLIKPQFEAGREEVGKHGVVKDLRVHFDVVRRIADFAEGVGFYPAGLNFSPVKGPEGNIEFLLYLKKSPDSSFKIDDDLIKKVVDMAHADLDLKEKK